MALLQSPPPLHLFQQQFSSASAPSSVDFPQKSSKRKRQSLPSVSLFSLSSSDTMPSSVLDLAVDAPAKLAFEPTKHLNFKSPSKIWTMKEIGLEHEGVSPVAVSEPFSLFTEDAIKQMRSEIFNKQVISKHQFSSNLAGCQLRGFAPEFAPFIYDVWHHPEVLSIISKIAGIELVPQMDWEIAHINISLNSEEEQEEAKKYIAEHKQRELDEGVSGCAYEDDKPVVDWHTDSYPFVCVTMLSDCTNMVGGETALRTGTGEIKRVRGPSMGHSVILQGRYIEHQALRTLGGSERITMVTSFRPKSAFIKDDTVLTTVRAISDLSKLYSQYAEYRLEMLQQRIQAQLEQLKEQKKGGPIKFDTYRTKAFIREQKAFLTSMLAEMVDDDKVIKGFTDDSHLLSKKKAKLMSADAEQ